MDSTAEKPDSKKIDVPPFTLMYAKSVAVPPGTSGNTEMRGFKSRWSMYWFALTDPAARAAVIAGRVRFLEVADTPTGS